ncbi:MAG: 4Fe-4S dicluster domain-containing protein [Armatimonadetes bacterium]|nr:4Fe-4S dicluster domain-containing protein [Armatimonadota bacterium]
MSKVISQDKISDFLNSLMAKYTVVAPMPRHDAPAEFRELKSGDQPIIDGSSPMMPPKDFFLPRYEVLVNVQMGKDGVKLDSPIPEAKPRVLLGAWLPDLQGIQVLDRVFLDKKFTDPYYAARRENTILVAVMPAKLRWSWFCSATDDVEGWKNSVDAIMYDLGDKFYIEPTSDKGNVITEGSFLTDASDADSAAKDAIWDNFKTATKLPMSDERLYEKLAWENPIWGEIAEKCIACGICSYSCPSCSCFDIQDETCGSCVERYRCRDTCQFEEFTLMGHGYNPRDNQLPRVRQRLLHKFKYQHEQFGVVGCTGCGRCVELCPVNVDIRDVLMRTCSVENQETPAES